MEYPYEERVLGNILEDKAIKNKEKPFFYFEDKVFSYKIVNEKSNRLANGYKSLGIKKGDRVVAMLPNCPEFIFHWFALAKLGGVDTPINTSYKGDILRHVINICDAKVMVVHEEFIDRITFIKDDLPHLEKLVVFSPSRKSIDTRLNVEVILFDDLLEKEDEFISEETVSPSDPLMIIYTSGTTGPSKGAVLPHQAIYFYALDTIQSLGFKETDIIFSNLPLYHINCRFFAVVSSLLLDAPFAIVSRFSASRFWDEIRRYKATAFCFTGGAMVNFIYNQPPKEDDKDNPVRLAWMISGEMTKKFEERFNLKIYLGYFGMTEANWITSNNFKEMDRLKEEGKEDQALGMGRENKDRYEVRLVDENDNEVPTGQAGEIICRPTRPYSMMTEYINMPDKTLEAFRNLWFHTGDMAKKDEEGFFYFVDRKKDYIRRRGENVSSYEVEKVINAYPEVIESAAIGVKLELGEEEILVIIRPREKEKFRYEDLMAWCEGRMPYFMIPRYVKLVNEELPKTPTGRVQKYMLREMDKEKGVWDREQAGYTIKR